MHEVRVEVDEDNVLEITGERSVRREEKGDKWHHIERSSATFHLPEDGVKAAMDGGMLTVTVPKFHAVAEKPEAKAAIEAGP
ncbi:hypothetical protein QOZ80_3BG0287000 [Eleusine coracana subsp. coracana]|nr:hypothetical protein QOZ80_3BG0287000 [Eleusine coracana subsp. coracana]